MSILFLPDLKVTSSKTKRSIIEWSGLNRLDAVKDNELTTSTNLSSRKLPYLSPRPSRAVSYTLSGTGWALGSAAQLYWVDGTSFKYNNVVEGTVTAAAKSFAEISERIVIFPDKKSYDIATDAFAAFGSGDWYATDPPVAGSIPDIKYACMLDNRIWGVDDRDNICCTALGDFDDWTTYSSPSEATDAWSVDTGTTGDFTGICKYRQTNIAFKIDGMWKRFGDIPDNFAFLRVSDIGCLSHKSICEVNGILFWLGRQGVYAYTGGIPDLISEKLNDTYSSAVAGGDGRCYYISLYDGSTYKLYVYDTWKNIWMQEDTLQVKDFTYLNGYLYALAADNKIYCFNSGTESISSTIITAAWTNKTSNKKGHMQITARVDLETGATMTVSEKVDNGSWVAIKSAYATTDLLAVRMPVLVKRADHYSLKFEFTGDYKLYELERFFYEGGDV